MKTNWFPLSNNKKARYVGPEWIARLIVWADQKTVHPLIGYLFSKISKWSGAYFEIRPVQNISIKDT